MSPRILVTGGAGFIGGHVTTALLDAGHEVAVLDSLLPAAWNAATPDVDPRARVTIGDVRDQRLLGTLLRDVDVVFHHAAMVGMGRDAGDLPAFVANNDLGTAVLLAAMTQARVRRLVLASSMVVYGEGAYDCRDHGRVRPAARQPADLAAGRFDPACPVCGQSLAWRAVDEGAPVAPRSTYAATKAAQEHLAGAWQRDTDGHVIALRYHNVYGPRMPRNTPYAGVAAIFRSALEAGLPPQVFEDGGQTRDFVHVHDVAAANVRALQHIDDATFLTLNIASGTPVTVLEMAQTLSDAFGGPAPRVTGEYRPGDVRHVVASVQRASRLLGFRARIPTPDGLTDFAASPLRG